MQILAPHSLLFNQAALEEVHQQLHVGVRDQRLDGLHKVDAVLRVKPDNGG